jgi:hypothetical protein
MRGECIRFLGAGLMCPREDRLTGVVAENPFHLANMLEDGKHAGKGGRWAAQERVDRLLLLVVGRLLLRRDLVMLGVLGERSPLVSLNRRTSAHASVCFSIRSKIGSAAAGTASLSAFASAGAIGVAATAKPIRRARREG